MSLTCGAKWCSDCPFGWHKGSVCRKSEEIIDQAEAYEAEGRAALDAYDLVHPEDFFSA